ncbi:hypothetical protein JVU11DRAFT_1760 [Chiua virens]|nr:hypothetical protein JVU11DRAFT_1760 [Chiua virens]
MTTQNDKERLLSILNTHGQQFLSAFDILSTKKFETNDRNDSESEEEWKGIGSSESAGGSSASESALDDEHDSGSEQGDDGFTASSSRTPNVTVFVGSTWKQREINLSAKELRKSFMSSKVSNVTSSTQPISKERIPNEESDEERTNAQNDAILHRLVHTKLLSGSLNPELDLDHAQRGRALTGRVLELAGEAKLGKGENASRQEERNKAAKRVREGLARKQKEQEKKTLEEAKNLGNYHPTLKRLYDSSTSAPKKKRARGLGMGVGKFVGGALKLSREEIASVTGPRKMAHGTGRRKMRQWPR